MMDWNMCHVSSKVMRRSLGNGTSAIGVIHHRLRKEVATAPDIIRMEDVVILKGEIRLQIRTGNPLIHGPSVNQSGIVRVCFGAKGVHHVLQCRLMPERGVRMRGEYQFAQS